MLLETLADQAAELDEIANDLFGDYRARISEILNDLDERDPDVWALYSEDVDLAIEDFASVPRQDKDTEWLERFADMVVAARMQAFAELLLEGVLSAAESHGEKTNSMALGASLNDMRKAAKVGISKDSIATAAQKRAAKRAGVL